ncbi:unnamed protein product, partial [Medioppia subpectinata]
MASKTVKLNNGRDFPLVGLGTWKAPEGAVYEAVKAAIDAGYRLGTWKAPEGAVYEAVKAAIDAGYRHIDCAFAYGNEAEVGRALKESIGSGKVKREELFITSKLWNTYHKRERVGLCLDITLKDLGLDYLDLYLIHWPLGYQEGEEKFPKNAAGEVLVSDVDFVETYLGL